MPDHISAFLFVLRLFFACLWAIDSEVVALKKLKMEKEKEGFPITALREITTLLMVRLAPLWLTRYAHFMAL